MEQIGPSSKPCKADMSHGKRRQEAKREYSHHSGKGVSALATKKKKAPARKKKAAKRKAPAKKKAAKRKAPARRKAAKKKK